MKKITIALFMLPCFAAHADEFQYQKIGPYVYAGAGYANTSFDGNQIVATTQSAGTKTVLSSSNDGANPAAYRLRGGYQITNNLGVELGYTSVGQINFSETWIGKGVGAANNYANASGTMKIYDAVGTASTSIYDGIYLMGKLGVSRLTFSGSATDIYSGNGMVFGSSGSDTKTGITVGVGLKYYLDESASIRLDVDRYQVPSGDFISAFEIFSAGIQYQF